MEKTARRPLRRAIKLTMLAAFAAAAVFLVSCREPSPLYGSWADNRGNTLSFFDDDTFSARIVRSGRPSENFNGNYSLLMNVLTLDCRNVELRIVTEWDIRGNILYLTWTSADGEAMQLSMYKISN